MYKCGFSSLLLIITPQRFPSQYFHYLAWSVEFSKWCWVYGHVVMLLGGIALRKNTRRIAVWCTTDWGHMVGSHGMKCSRHISDQMAKRTCCMNRTAPSSLSPFYRSKMVPGGNIAGGGAG